MNVMEELNVLMRARAGEYVSESELGRLEAKNQKQDLVRALVLEKMKIEGIDVVNFHFTPGSNFEEMEVNEIVTNLVDFYKKIMKGELISDPPHTGRKKENSIWRLDMLKEMIKDNVVNFCYYKDGDLWYSLKHDGGKVFMFPVPISDVGTATMMHQDKALLFMRYIRKHLKELENNR